MVPLAAASRRGFLAIALVLLLLADCAAAKSASGERVLTVTATAFNATRAQTDGKPHLGAWGDRLDKIPPGTRALAVSPDLAAKGLHRNRRVRIDGLEGDFVVLDRTASDKRNTVDIFMGLDARAAREFGRRKVKIRWTPAPPSGKSHDRTPRR